MPEVRGDRFLGEEAMRITVVGVLAIAGVIIALLLLIVPLNTVDGEGPKQSHA